MSGKREKFDITNTDDATHVYVKVDNPKSLYSKFEGPYEIVSRPSRSTLTVKLGLFKDNSPRLATYHWSSCRVAHLREGATSASRPALGRPPKLAPQSAGTDFPSSEPANGPEPTDNQNKPVEPDLFLAGPPSSETLPANIQNDDQPVPSVDESIARPVRSTRNQNPSYT